MKPYTSLFEEAKASIKIKKNDINGEEGQYISKIFNQLGLVNKLDYTVKNNSIIVFSNRTDVDALIYFLNKENIKFSKLQ